MGRKSIRPYEEITILSLGNITNETKFQLFCKIKAKEEAYIILSDDHSESKFSLKDKKFLDVHIGDVVMAFGQKNGEEMYLDKLIKLNLDWSLLVKTRALEQM